MSAVDDVIKTVGEAVGIIRTGGNVNTYFYMSPKGNWSARAPYEREVMIPTDSGVVEGDLIQHRSDYYLTVGLFEDRRVGEFFYYKARLYKCNLSVTVRSQNATTKQFQDAMTGVRCLITPGAGETPEDKANVIPRYSGKDMLFLCFMQANVGLTKNNLLVGSDNRVFRVLEDIDPYFAKNITRALVKIEKYA